MNHDCDLLLLATVNHACWSPGQSRESLRTVVAVVNDTTAMQQCCSMTAKHNFRKSKRRSVVAISITVFRIKTEMKAQLDDNSNTH